ncbi:MAG: hypothetical protein HFI43_14735 [Lachnospiraceae bacterium]|jgi:hypothetical protein|nr:hypothetical protein [Lachnospiraceae bacterium]GFI15007.1 hypothetical protein IMSAGC009_00161 [Lachnospiraceae bacterium]
MEGNLYEKTFLDFDSFAFLLSGCSKEISVNKPYEIVKGTSTLSYFDTEDNISIDDFNIIENDIQDFEDINDNIIVNDDEVIRCITIVSDTVKTFQSISVGDSIDKIEDTFDYERRYTNDYIVFFADDKEEDSAIQNKEDSWIWITYRTDGSKITSIMIFDVKYGRTNK